MNGNDKSLQDTLAEMLATLTAKSILLEQQRDEALKKADEWYKCYLKRGEEIKKLEADLAAEKEELDYTRYILGDVLKINK